MIAAGVLQWSAFGSLFAGSLRVSFAITLTFGIGMTLYERMRHRADAADLALRTKERDEAEARRLAAEAQLASIESRVQPHFLFNTLNSIAALVHDDPAGAERMTGQLASLLRSALDSTATPLVPLDEELRVVRAYLDIERVRFGDRLRYAIDVRRRARRRPSCRAWRCRRWSRTASSTPSRRGAKADRSACARPPRRPRARRPSKTTAPGSTRRSARRPRPRAARRAAGDARSATARRCDVDSRPGPAGVTIDVPSDPPSPFDDAMRATSSTTSGWRSSG